MDENEMKEIAAVENADLEKASYDAVCRVFGCDPMYFGNKAEITARECDYLFRAGAEWAFGQFESMGTFPIEDARGGYWPTEYFVRKK